jgi:hypothetical protein
LWRFSLRDVPLTRLDQTGGAALTHVFFTTTFGVLSAFKQCRKARSKAALKAFSLGKSSTCRVCVRVAQQLR